MLPYKERGLTAWFDEHENYVNLMLWPLQSTALNPMGHTYSHPYICMTPIVPSYRLPGISHSCVHTSFPRWHNSCWEHHSYPSFSVYKMQSWTLRPARGDWHCFTLQKNRGYGWKNYENYGQAVCVEFPGSQACSATGCRWNTFGRWKIKLTISKEKREREREKTNYMKHG